MEAKDDKIPTQMRETDIQHSEPNQERTSGLKKLLAKIRSQNPKPETEKPEDKIPDYLNNTLWHTSKDIKRTNPEIGKTIDIVFEEIDKQAVENYKIFQSDLYPGTVFTYSMLTITPELITRIAKENPGALLSNPPEIENPTTPENDTTACFGYFLIPPQGHALDVLDMATDKFMRKLSKVAHAMKNGQTPPNVEIYMIGSTTGFGGKLGNEFYHDVAKKGFTAIGALDGEFINSVVLKDKDPQNTHLLLEGGSMGAPTADHTLPFIDEGFHKNTQLLLDVPAGHHKPGLGTITKGIQTPVGLAAETAYRMTFDERTKDPGKRAKRLAVYLKNEKGIIDDDSNIKRLKTMLFSLGLKLVKGTPLSYEKGTYIRNATRDPLTTGLGRKHLIEKDLGKPIITHSMKRREKHPEEYIGKEPYPVEKAKVNMPFWKTGHALETAVDGTHFWRYNKKFNRWQKILEYCKSPAKKPAQAEATPSQTAYKLLQH